MSRTAADQSGPLKRFGNTLFFFFNTNVSIGVHGDKSDCVKSTIHARFNPGNHTQLWYNICM